MVGEADTAPRTAAHLYQQHHLRPVPIRPQGQGPWPDEWQLAQPDTAQIDRWWNHRPSSGVGLVMGTQPDGTHLIAVDIDNHPGQPSGDDTLHDLEQAYGKLPDTVEAITGGGGRHLIYRTPEPLPNGVLGPGIDIKGHHGQIVVWPTAHARTHIKYEWEHGHAPWEHPVADCPQWLLAEYARTRPEPPEPRTPSPANRDLPGDLWAAETPWEQLLTGSGAVHKRTSRDGEQFWVRPNKDPRLEHGATLYYKGLDVLYTFTPNWPGLEQHRTYNKFAYLTYTQFDGDFRAAADYLRTEGWGTPRNEDDDDFSWVDPGSGSSSDAGPSPPAPAGWEYAPLEDHVNGTYTRPQPSFLRRSTT